MFKDGTEIAAIPVQEKFVFDVLFLHDAASYFEVFYTRIEIRFMVKWR